MFATENVVIIKSVLTVMLFVVPVDVNANADRVRKKNEAGGNGVVVIMKSDLLYVKRQPGRITVPCGTRKTNNVTIVMVGKVLLGVEVGGAKGPCGRGRDVVGGVGVRSKHGLLMLGGNTDRKAENGKRKSKTEKATMWEVGSKIGIT